MSSLLPKETIEWGPGEEALAKLLLASGRVDYRAEFEQRKATIEGGPWTPRIREIPDDPHGEVYHAIVQNEEEQLEVNVRAHTTLAMARAEAQDFAVILNEQGTLGSEISYAVELKNT